jgi:hypothetical protein
MPITPPPTVLPNRLTQTPEEFSDACDDLFSWIPTFVEDADAAVDEVNANATAAASYASAAEGAAAAVSAANFNPLTVYAAGQAAVSLQDWQTYRRRTAGQSVTDPSQDSTNWARVVVGVGVGATAFAGAAGITVTSGSLIVVTPTQYGQWVTLPPANTLHEGALNQLIHNNGPYPVKLRDGTGTVIGFIEPLGFCIASCLDNSSTAGSWKHTGRLYALDAVGSVTFSSAPGTTPASRAVTLSDSFTLLLIGGGTSLHAVVYDHLNNAFGTPALVRTAAVTDKFIATLVSFGKVLVVSCNATTALEAVVLDIASTAITVNTPATDTLAGNIASLGDPNTDGTGIVQVGSAFVFGYTRATTVAGIRAITISGSTPAIGAETATTGTGVVPVIFAVSGSTYPCLVMSQVSGGNISVRQYQLTGTTFTAGAAPSAITATVTGFVARAMGNRFGITYSNTQRFGAIVTPDNGSPGTLSINTVQLSAAASASNPCVTVVDSGARMIVASDNGSTVMNINVLSDNGGGAVAGTAITRTIQSSTLAYLGSTASQLWASVTVGTGSTSVAFMAIGFSGNDPVMSNVQIGGPASTSIASGSGSSSYKGTTSDLTYLVGSTIAAALIPTGVQTMAFAFNGAAPILVPVLPSGPTIVTARQSASQVWQGGYLNGAAGMIWNFRRASAV